MNDSERPIDIAIFGATGFTGRLMAEYMASEYGNDGSGPRWALAGRDADRLAQLRDAVAAPADTPIIVADLDDPESLSRLARQTRVLLTTAGPFAYYGEPVLRACIEAGTDYADLTGEPLWIREMIGKYEAAASAGSARVAFCSGYDCIPIELGVLLVQQECMSRFGRPAPRVNCRIGTFDSLASGGSAATGVAMREALAAHPELVAVMRDPFALIPGFSGPAQPKTSAPEWDELTSQWAAPAVMTFINSKVVHRSNMLQGFPYGTDFIYHESALMGEGEQGRQAAEDSMQARLTIGADSPKPGEGPSREHCFGSHWDMLMIGEMPDRETVRYSIEGKYDLGYASTARMLVETGIALLSSDAAPGLSLPGVLLGNALVKRLEEHAKVRFILEN